MSDPGKLKDPPDYGEGDKDQDGDVDDRKPSPILEGQGNSRLNHVGVEGSTHQVSGGSDEGNNVIMPSRVVHSEATDKHHHRASPNSVGGRSSPSSIEDHHRRRNSSSRDRGSQQQHQRQQRKRKTNYDGDDDNNDPMNDNDHGGIHYRQQHESSLSEIEHKREASRISSRRNQERQRKRIEFLLAEESRLQETNHQLRVENEIMQNDIVSIREVLRSRQQQQQPQQQPHLPSSTTTAAAAPSTSTASIPGSIVAPSLQGQQPNSNIQNLSHMLYQSIQQIPSPATQNGVLRSLQSVAGIISGTLCANVTMPQQQFSNQPTSNQPTFGIPQIQLNTDFSRGPPTPGSASTQQDLLSAVEQLQSLVSLLFLLNMALVQQSSNQNMALSVQQNPSQSTFVQSTQPTWQNQPPPPQQQQQPPSQPSLASPYQQVGPSVAIHPQPSQQPLQFSLTMENLQQHQQSGSAQAAYFGNQSPIYQKQQQQQQQQQLPSQSGYVPSEQAPQQQQQYDSQLQQQQYLLSLLNSGLVVNPQQQPVDAGGVRAAQGITQSNIPSHPHMQRQHQQEQEQLHHQQIHQAVQQPLTFLGGQGSNINPIQFGISQPEQQQQQQPQQQQQQPPQPGQGGSGDNSNNNRMRDDNNYNADRSDFF